MVETKNNIGAVCNMDSTFKPPLLPHYLPLIKLSFYSYSPPHFISTTPITNLN